MRGIGRWLVLLTASSKTVALERQKPNEDGTVGHCRPSDEDVKVNSVGYTGTGVRACGPDRQLLPSAF